MTRFRSIALISIFCAAGLFAQSGAQTQPAAVSVPAAGEDDAPLQLSLDEAVRTAARQNLGVEIERLDFRAIGNQSRATYGIFDPLAFADASAASRQQPVTSVIFSPESESWVANYGVNQTLPTGGTYSVGFNNARNESNNRFTTVNPAYNSELGFSITHPLLRNFGIDVTRRNINIARNTLGISREEFRNVLTLTAVSVEQAYLDLIFARLNADVKRQSRDLAREQERITQIRIDVGASAPLDILQPRVAIATREEEVITAEAQIRSAEDRLRQLMNLPAEEWDRPIVPTTDIPFEQVQLNAESAVAEAFERRPEVAQARLGIDTRRIQSLYARNQTLPRLDVRLDYGFAGLGGDVIERDDNGAPIGVRSGGYGDALDQLYGFDFPSWTVGVNLGVPVRNISARSEARRAELELERARTDEERIRQSIAVDVRQAIRNIDTSAKQIAATRAAREAAERNVEAERRRYENGMTTNFNVLLIQQELSDARSREIAALVAYRKSVADYHRAVGDLLEVRGIAVEEPETFEMPRSRFENVRWMNYESWTKE